MIIRVFRARVRAGKHAEYEQLLRADAIPLMRRQAGVIALYVGTPMLPSPDEYVMVSIWQDMNAMRAFTGPSWQNAVVLPGEAEMVAETIVHHYQSIATKPGDGAQIIRVFRARIRDGKTGEFKRLVQEQSIPWVERADGMRGYFSGESFIESEREFVMVTLWRDIEAVKTFAGDNWQTPVVTPDEASLVAEMFAHHYTPFK